MWVAQVKNNSKDTWLCTCCRIATTWWARAIGLMGVRAPDNGWGLLLAPAKGGVHTFFMRFPIDVAYLSPDLRVVALHQGIPPWRVWLPRMKDAMLALELPAGRLAETNTQIGDKLTITLLQWQ